MIDIPASTPTTDTPAVKTPRDNEIQSKRIADGIASNDRQIKTVLASPTLVLALAPYGYNETKLNEGPVLATAAQTAFAERQTAMAGYAAAYAVCSKARESARKDYKSYRRIVQANFKGDLRANLGASGRVPSDNDKFRTTARAAYTTALGSPQLAQLSENGWTIERLNTANAQLDLLVTEESNLKAAESNAQAATETRDEAAKNLQAWVTKLRAIAKDALEEKPELLSLMSSK